MKRYRTIAIAICVASAMPAFSNTDRNASGKAANEPLLKKKAEDFKLTSPAIKDGGLLPVKFTGDGSAATLPLCWTGAPAGTQCFAVIMHHIAPDKIKWYWILYNIPATTTALPCNVSSTVGLRGNNSVNDRAEYAPPHSKGPGKKRYIYTLYALSAPVVMKIPAEQVGRDELLAAMKGKILGTAKLKTIYERQGLNTPPKRREERR